MYRLLKKSIHLPCGAPLLKAGATLKVKDNTPDKDGDIKIYSSLSNEKRNNWNYTNLEYLESNSTLEVSLSNINDYESH